MDLNTLQNWLWRAACSIRGEVDAARYKDYQVRQVGELYLSWQEEEDVSAVVKVAEVVRNDYNLSPSRYVASNDVEPPLPLEEAIVLMQDPRKPRPTPSWTR